jgi:hypothetical protein
MLFVKSNGAAPQPRLLLHQLAEESVWYARVLLWRISWSKIRARLSGLERSLAASKARANYLDKIQTLF